MFAICDTRNVQAVQKVFVKKISQLLFLIFVDTCPFMMPSIDYTTFYFLFLLDWRTEALFLEPLIPLFWTSGDVSSGFQS